MTAHPFHGTIRNGQFIAEDRGYDRFVASFEGKRVTKTIQLYRKARTKKQQGFLWCSEGPYQTIATGLNQRGRQLVAEGVIKTAAFFEPDDVHEMMKDLFLKQFAGFDDTYTKRSTTELTTEEMSAYWEEMAHWAASLGIYVAFPSDAELMSFMEKRNR